jgi:hypothetical protein
MLGFSAHIPMMELLAFAKKNMATFLAIVSIMFAYFYNLLGASV